MELRETSMKPARRLSVGDVVLGGTGAQFTVVAIAQYPADTVHVLADTGSSESWIRVEASELVEVIDE